MEPSDELDGKVTVRVAGEDVVVERPPFRRLRPILAMPSIQALMSLEVDDDGNAKGQVPLEAVVDMGEAFGAVLFGADWNAILDRIFTMADWGVFVGSAVDALQLGEAIASTGS